MRRSIVVLSLGGALAACVTINIYFPAAAAQEVADEIINDVWQLEEGEASKATGGASTKPTSIETSESK